jgi:soluble lytic murein transglycosylase-like protein
MFKNAVRKLRDRRYGRISSALLFLGLALTIGLALTNSVTTPREQEDTCHPVSQTRADATVLADAAVNVETTKLVILQWMKKHSEMPEQVLSKVYSVAMNNVNADLVLAICLVESNFNPNVESEKGAMGLMGIMPDVWLEELKTRGIVREQDDLFRISNNINSGIYVLGRYLARTNNVKEALIRYAGGDPAYAGRVLQILGEISRVRRSEDQLFAASIPHDYITRQLTRIP